MWHVFVLAASCCFFAVCYVEIAAGSWEHI
jgi:predicted membrane channel-forming protein YqfA (hemolysin III family)